MPKPVCSYKECPWRFEPEEHYPFCGHIPDHGHTNVPTHQHKPRRSQMKNPPIVALLCPALHDAVDNSTKYRDEVRYEKVFAVGRTRYYRLWKPEDEHRAEGWALIWREIPDAQGTQHTHEADRAVDVELVPGLQDGRDLVQDADTVGGLREPVSELTLWCQRGAWLYHEYVGLKDDMDHWRWRLGDWFKEGEDRFGELAYSFTEPFKSESVRGYVWVSERVVAEQRELAPTWSHARAVARLSPPEQREWLSKAKAEGLTAQELRAEIRGPQDVEMHDCPECGALHRRKE